MTSGYGRNLAKKRCKGAVLFRHVPALAYTGNALHQPEGSVREILPFVVGFRLGSNQPALVIVVVQCAMCRQPVQKLNRRDETLWTGYLDRILFWRGDLTRQTKLSLQPCW